MLSNITSNFTCLRTVDPNLPQQTETLSKYKTGRPRRKKKGTAFEGQYLLWGRSIGRTVGQSVGARKEGRKAEEREGGREKRLIEKDSEMLTADRQKRQGAEILDSTNLPPKNMLVYFTISHLTLYDPSWTCKGRMLFYLKRLIVRA